MPLQARRQPLTSYPPNNFSYPNPKQQHHWNASSIVETSRNSSLQKVWEEDYFADPIEGESISFDCGERDNHWEIPTTPPPAALTSRLYQSDALTQDENSNTTQNTRPLQRSLSTFLPFRSPTRTNSTSPERKSPVKETKEEGDDFMATLTGDRSGVIKVADKSKGGIASWFAGSSAPVQVGIPVIEQDLPPSTMSSARDPSPEREPSKLRKRPTLPTLESNMSATTQAKNTGWRGNFFSSPKTPLKAQTVQIPADLNNDEFLTLDITTALFPSGEPTAQDPFSPSAFKNLLMNAEGLLLKLQTAYKLRTLSLHELTAEKEAMAEELDEAETRAKCLKSQLEDMAQTVSTQDQALQEMAAELAMEKKLRAEEQEAREKSIALVKASAEKRNSGSELSINTREEDLGIATARRKRISRDTDISTEGDSDGESGGESVFSRSRSPTFTLGSATSVSASVSVAGTEYSTPEIKQASFGRMVPNPHTGAFATRPKAEKQKSTFQKLLGGMTNTEAIQSQVAVAGCANCEGKDSSVAWDTVGLLRAENKGLKDRVVELETAVDGALDLITYGVAA